MNFFKNNQENLNTNNNALSKRNVFILLILTLPVMGWSQNTTKFQSTLKEKGFTEVEWTYLRQMKTAAKALDICSKSKSKCDLTDPVTDKKSSAKEQISSILSGVYPSRSVQKNMAEFEKQLNRSKKFPKKQLEIAFKKHPGYSYKAMSSRMGFYIMSMESVNDDE